MIKNYVILDEAGVYPVSVGANFTIPEGAVEVDQDANGYLTCMLVDGLWEGRPEVSPPLVVGNIVTFTDLPDGVTITVRDLETQAVLAVTDEPVFQLTDPATYEIEVLPPLPWLPWTGRVTC